MDAGTGNIQRLNTAQPSPGPHSFPAKKGAEIEVALGDFNAMMPDRS